MLMRSLGASGLEVSALALGSWRTYERLTRDAGLTVMREARLQGITFLDDARYDDETGTAPVASGYSEVVFGELFGATRPGQVAENATAVDLVSRLDDADWVELRALAAG
jgi:aryl-alcohol dehydrogenase-like predicted oxidoreductase